MTDITQTLQDRSRQQAEMTAMMAKLRADYIRYAAVETLGCKTEKDALQAATKHLTRATADDINAALKEIEAIKGKTYSGSVPYAGIADTLKQGGITKAEIPAWIDACKKESYCSGHRYQPLPSHDEAWKTYAAVHTSMHNKHFVAEQLKYRTQPITLTDKEIIQAASWGFWDDMSKGLRRRLYLLLPITKRDELKKLTPDEAMQATRKHYDKMMEVYK